ncbi:MAG: fructose-specific PTS transporter subunit EIIC [Anaerococcus sp.]|uniref:PTS fructose transporter subunit IIABC n=1 Tax=Anaerococcus sp. TaxID=1872515 RepID=UPI002632E21F|nr:fructose-specific PTS transporter subunit EIIC [Anaerococcus sp.]MCI5972759.1 fructose-specific PTS transporter subunit EIIC [Anaerococcus sp.]MDD6918816.1 fructose-specific PTS transporter subunit EIIC [Peptoniphilaceae bacterium]MDY2928443.1 fructose-specific PTS transporter subunit EIIC [Anaerococcus sp.]
MEIRDLLKPELMIFDLQANDKMSAIEEIASKFFEKGYVKDKEDFKNGLIAREEEGSTALGESVAIPHTKNETVKEPAVLFARKIGGLDYEALDGEPTEIFFSIGAPAGENNLHVETLAELSKMIMKEGFIDDLKKCSSPEEVYGIIDKYSEKKKAPVVEEEAKNSDIKLLAVTACPNGIAHTYMAQEALEKAAKKAGVSIKVETNGSDGIKNRLTDKEIEEADAIIIAADKKVETNRFDGKRLIQRPVSDGIRKSNELIEKAIKGEGRIFKAEEGANKTSTDDGEGQSFWQKIYGDLMNGISHMLPFVIGGGILMAISFLVERFAGDESLAFTFLNGLGGDAFSFLIPILAGFIAMSIGDRPALMPGMVAGLMASRGAGFIGGLIGGFLAGYVVNLMKKAYKNLPKSIEGLKPMLIYPVFGLLIVGALMFFIIDPIFTGINTFINNWLMSLSGANMLLLGAILAGMMAIDMGGPINKAAYAFAIGAFTDTGIGTFMAAVMVGGMVPPIAIAIATTFFKDKFTEDQKKTTITNYILGLSFITEGAIPFAAAEPGKVIPASVIGSAIAGAIVGGFNISAPAPHGGIFVLPAMSSLSQAGLFLGAVLVGSVVGGLIYGFMKKND